MIKHIQDVYRRIRYHYDQITQPPAPVEPNLGIRTGTTNNSILGSLFAKTEITATGLTTAPRADTVTEAWYNVGKHMRETMEAMDKKLQAETDGAWKDLRDIEATRRAMAQAETGAPALLSEPLRSAFAELVLHDTRKHKTAKQLLTTIIKEELFVHTPKWANMIIFSFVDNKLVVGARDSYRGTELSLAEWLKPSTRESLYSHRYYFRIAYGDTYFFQLNELYPTFEQEYDDEPTAYFSADGGAE